LGRIGMAWMMTGSSVSAPRMPISSRAPFLQQGTVARRADQHHHVVVVVGDLPDRVPGCLQDVQVIDVVLACRPADPHVDKISCLGVMRQAAFRRRHAPLAGPIMGCRRTRHAA